MNQFIPASILLLISLTAAQAADQVTYTSPGWYQVADSAFEMRLVAGPFADQSSCEVDLPPFADGIDYQCENITANPGFDS